MQKLTISFSFGFDYLFASLRFLVCLIILCFSVISITFFHCVVPEVIHTPPTEGIGNSREEVGGSKTQKLKALYEA